ncbi:MAG: tRNA pseudouridine(38-40) synthase TruA [Anaerolineae bacterium]|nr:tRNA pseudouridine(38-40) synthase TruA [Anaerolineae bacterium]
MTARYRATLAYDGSGYQGFQRQAEGIPSIQGAVEQAIQQVTQQSVTVIGSGRTDSGVHATGQVIAFDVMWKHSELDLLRAVNAVLPEQIALQDITRQEGFHPRFDARARRYAYTVVNALQRQPLLRNRTWHIWSKLDVAAMAAAAAMLNGEHDFGTFGQPPQGTSTVRVIFHSAWAVYPEVYGQRLVYTVKGNAFLQHMVRRIVGLMVDVGLGSIDVEAFARAFQAADISQSGTVAPPQGLVLEAVYYD